MLYTVCISVQWHEREGEAGWEREGGREREGEREREGRWERGGGERERENENERVSEREVGDKLRKTWRKEHVGMHAKFHQHLYLA